MRRKLDFYDIHNDVVDQNALVKDRSLLVPIVVAASEIEVISPQVVVTPPRPLQNVKLNPSTTPLRNDSTMDAIATCSSTATDDMLDTVDDCVGCVNQISLQHDFEDSFVDITMDSRGIATLPHTDDDAFDIKSTEDAKQKRSSLQSKESPGTCVAVDEDNVSQQDEELDLLNWCSGGFQRKQC
jgi:hypothetical protein